MFWQAAGVFAVTGSAARLIFVAVINMATGEIIVESLNRLADILIASSLGEHGGIDGVINSAHFSVSPFVVLFFAEDRIYLQGKPQAPRNQVGGAV